MRARRLGIVVALLAVPAVLLAQTPASRWGSVKAFPHGYVDRSNLNVHLEFPIFTRSTVGRAQVGAVLTYDSGIWDVYNGGAFAETGWHLFANTGGTVTAQDDWHYSACGWQDPEGGYDDGSGDIDYIHYYFNAPDGVQYYLGEDVEVDGPNGYQPDGYVDDCPDDSDGIPTAVVQGEHDSYTVNVDGNGDATATDSEGDNVLNGFTDTHGNQVTESTPGGTTTITDPLGTALTISGSNPVTYTYTPPGGGGASVTETFASITASNAGFGCSPAYSAPMTVPVELQYANGDTYDFGYDSAGRLDQLTLPSGGVIHFDATASCSTGMFSKTLSRWNSLDGSSHPWFWSDPGAGTTTETSPAGNDSVFSFTTLGYSGPKAVLAEADLYSGSAASGTELSKTTIATTYTSGYVSTHTTTTELFGATNRYSVHTASFDAYGAPTATSTSDWGTTPSGGSMLRQTSSTMYVAPSNSKDEVLTQKLLDGGGAVKAETDYTYAGNGDLDQVSQQNGAGWLTKSYSYNPNGTVATATDVNGAVASYTYGACNSIFPTVIQSPVTPVKTTLQWDCTGGVATASTDGNNLTTYYTYSGADHTWRLTSTTAPDGAVTNLSRLSATQSESAMNFSGGSGVSATTDTLVTLDALGRLSLTQKRLAPGSGTFDSVQTVYDTMGRVSQLSQPYQAAAGAAAPGGTAWTATLYDALSRPLSVTDGGGGVTSYSYTQNDTLITRGAVSKQEQFDALGRLQSVCEITTTLAGNGACGQNVAQTGYLTTYARDPAGDITTVVQNAQAAAANQETRSFVYDELGRLTSESNPESGTTAYSFGASANCGTSTGNLAERVDANATITCYSHDVLGRVTQISYTPGAGVAATPTKNFVYDAATVDGVAMQNVAGRMAEAYTGDYNNELGFSYPSADAATVYQYTAGNWYTVASSSYPNGATATLSLPGVPAVTYTLDGEGRPDAASAGSTLATGATYNAAGQVTALALGTGNSDSYQYDAATGRMTQYTLTVNGGATDAGSLTWNSDGSPAGLVILNGIAGAGGSESCTYGHDDLGRLSGIDCGASWKQTFAYDPFGNITKEPGSSRSFDATYNAKNQISSNVSFVPNYDDNGDLLDDPVSGARDANVYDAEGHAVTLEGVPVVYDAMGRPVEANGSEIVWNGGGAKLVVMSGQTLQRAEVPLPGGAAAVYTAAGLVYYRNVDGRGSDVIETTAQGTLYGAAAYAPFAEYYNYTAASVASFTGKQGDIAGFNYDFPLRELNDVQGRWWTPDPAGLAAVDPNNPQSWNRYAYVGNTPLVATDPWGLFRAQPPLPCDGNFFWCGIQALTKFLEPSDPPEATPGGGGGGGKGTSTPPKPGPLPPDCPHGEKGIAPQQGQEIIAASLQFQTQPYSRQVCNQFVCNAINASGVEPGLHVYITTRSLPSSPYFARVSAPQVGDLVLFAGHVAFYAGPGQVLGALVHDRAGVAGAGLPGPGNMSWFGSVSGYYRLQVCN